MYEQARDAVLTKTDRNAVLTAVHAEGFTGTEFSWSEITWNELDQSRYSDFRVLKLQHDETGYYFIFGENYCSYSPGLNSKIEKEPHFRDGAVKVKHLIQWLERVHEEAEAPDLWAALRQEQSLGNAAASVTPNEIFSPKERSDINQKVDEIQCYLIEGRQLQEEQAQFVNQELSYLKKAADRLGRKDWLHVALAVLVNVGTTLAMDTNRMKGLLALAGSLFKSLWIEAAKFLS